MVMIINMLLMVSSIVIAIYIAGNIDITFMEKNAKKESGLKYIN